MSFVAGGARIWPVTPDWGAGVRETLAWSTDILQAAATAVTQHRALRLAPRRSIAFEVLAESQERRVADMLLAGHSGTWLLPLWPDVQWLAASLAAGSTEVPCATAGFDFVAGGSALLYTSVNAWEMAEIEAIEADHLVLAAATEAAYGVGARLYPLRRARVQDGAEERLHTDDLGRRGLIFDLVEPCDWPALAGPLYRGHLVLDQRPDESEDPTASVARLAQTVDYGTGMPVVHDLPDVALRAQQTRWVQEGRAEHSWLRSLLYALDGRRVPLWLPSWAADLKPAATVAGGAVTMSVEWTGYTQFGLGRANRQDLRLELVDGTVLYRRVTAAVQAGATETLTLDAALAAGAVAPASIRQISIMALATLASDEVEIEHLTDADGIATTTLGWQAVVPE